MLEVRYNEIMIIPYELTRVASLTKLDLSNNKITALPLELMDLCNLIALDISSNPLMGVPLHVIDGGAPAILEYLRNAAKKIGKA